MAKKKKSTETAQNTPRQDAFETAWQKFQPLVPPDELAALEASFAQPLSPSIRLNPAKPFFATVKSLQDRYGWDMQPVTFCPDGFKLSDPEIMPGQTQEHRCGAFYIQDSASMLPVTLFDADLFNGSPLILDLAASPGGKTTHLAARCAQGQDQGLILANDSSLPRVTALKKVMQTWGSVNHMITNFAGEFFGQWFPEMFDLILLDAPCSMQSLVSIDSHPMHPISEREENALAQRQALLLESAIQALKPGGQVVYSTCTLSPLEDEAVVNRMIGRFGAKISVLNASSRLPQPAPGITAYGNQAFSPEVAGTVRLWPHRYGTSGFFAALIQKNASLGESSEAAQRAQPAPQRPWDKSGFAGLSRKEAEQYRVELQALFGLDVFQQAESQGHTLFMRGTALWELPNLMLSDPFSALPCKSAGLRVATRTSAGWLPDFDWTSRNFGETQQYRYALDVEQARAWLQGQDLPISLPGLAKGTILFMMDDFGIFLGCGFVSTGRIRNLTK